MSIHDSCGYRVQATGSSRYKKPLQKCTSKLAEAEFSGTSCLSAAVIILAGAVPNEEVGAAHTQMRADQFLSGMLVVYRIGCVRSMTAGGKTPRYLPDLLFDCHAEPMPDTLDEYHSKLMGYIRSHEGQDPIKSSCRWNESIEFKRLGIFPRRFFWVWLPDQQGGLPGWHVFERIKTPLPAGSLGGEGWVLYNRVIYPGGDSWRPVPRTSLTTMSPTLTGDWTCTAFSSAMASGIIALGMSRSVSLVDGGGCHR